MCVYIYIYIYIQQPCGQSRHRAPKSSFWVFSGGANSQHFGWPNWANIVQFEAPLERKPSQCEQIRLRPQWAWGCAALKEAYKKIKRPRPQV